MTVRRAVATRLRRVAGRLRRSVGRPLGHRGGGTGTEVPDASEAVVPLMVWAQRHGVAVERILAPEAAEKSLPRTVEATLLPTYAMHLRLVHPERVLAMIPGARLFGRHGAVVTPDGTVVLAHELPGVLGPERMAIERSQVAAEVDRSGDWFSLVPAAYAGHDRPDLDRAVRDGVMAHFGVEFAEPNRRIFISRHRPRSSSRTTGRRSPARCSRPPGSCWSTPSIRRCTTSLTCSGRCARRWGTTTGSLLRSGSLSRVRSTTTSGSRSRCWPPPWSGPERVAPKVSGPGRDAGVDERDGLENR